MRKAFSIFGGAALCVALACPAWASEPATARDIQAAVDSYVASATQDASLVGGPGSAGYDSGFWIRGGDFSLRINATLQARYEALLFDAVDPANNAVGQPFDPRGGGGDRSGFSLPRATLKFSGTAPCNTRYYIELEFGHFGEDAFFPFANQNPNNVLSWGRQSENYSNTREAWIEWGCSPALNFRMGQIKIPTTRQLMTPPELQQFVDISLASSILGRILPGYTDRNRDFGAMIHGAVGCNNEFGYMIAVTNGDSGDSIRNILDGRTEDNLAYGARLNWAFAGATGYEEGALRQNTCTWYGELGGWVYYEVDRRDFAVGVNQRDQGDLLAAGGDLQLGFGGLSFTGAFHFIDVSSDNPTLGNWEGWGILAQAGYLFCDSAFEIAARYSYFKLEQDILPGNDNALTEMGAAINYYLNGHGNKLTLDAAFITAEDTLHPFLANHFDPYPGYAGFFQPGVGAAAPVPTDNDQILIRFQWQLAL